MNDHYRIFREQRQASLRWRIFLGILVLLAGITHYGAFLLGSWLAPKEIVVMRKTPPVAAPANALSQWQCSKQEYREYIHACASRKRAEMVKP